MGYSSRDYYRPTGFGGFSFFPPVIKYLLMINGLVFILQMLFNPMHMGGGLIGKVYIDQIFALNPLDPIYNYGLKYSFEIWQLITYQFMHGDFMHILFNMFLLWMFGMELANMWGAKKFLFYYLACGVGAGIFQLVIPFIFSAGGGPTIGASGAVFGIMIAFAMLFPDRYIYLYFLIPIKAKYLVAFLVVVEFMSVGNLDFIAHFAHIGGAITGFLFMLLDRRYQWDFNRLFSSKNFGQSGKGRTGKFHFRRPSGSVFNREDDVRDAEFYELNSKKDDINVSQEEIDRILDKISQSGYQNLTEREKKILFEASKRT